MFFIFWGGITCNTGLDCCVDWINWAQADTAQQVVLDRFLSFENLSSQDDGDRY